MTISKLVILILALATLSTSAFGQRLLDGKKAEKLEVRHSMVGFRNTLLFYTFGEEKAILVLSIGNEDETFPVTGKVHLFAPSTTVEGLGKWINNQHSDGLFVDIPMPESTEELPREACAVVSFEKVDLSRNPTDQAVFQDYEVKLSIKEQVVEGKFKLTEFTDTTRVHVRKR